MIAEYRPWEPVGIRDSDQDTLTPASRLGKWLPVGGDRHRGPMARSVLTARFVDQSRCRLSAPWPTCPRRLLRPSSTRSSSRTYRPFPAPGTKCSVKS